MEAFRIRTSADKNLPWFKCDTKRVHFGSVRDDIVFSINKNLNRWNIDFLFFWIYYLFMQKISIWDTNFSCISDNGKCNIENSQKNNQSGFFEMSICRQSGKSSSNSHNTICMSSYPRHLSSWLRRQNIMPLIAECKYSMQPYFISITRVFLSFLYIIKKKFDVRTCCLKFRTYV